MKMLTELWETLARVDLGLAVRHLCPLFLTMPMAASQIDADFTVNISSGINPLTVSFTDTTTGDTPLSWLWDFGDGGGSVIPNPIHTYTLDGMHTVSLTVMGPGFDVDIETKIDLIDVAPLPLVANFSASAAQGTNPFQLSFTDLSSGTPPTAWLWDFGDGSQATDQNPTHVFGTPGTFDVSLTVFIGQQSDTLTKLDLITVDPASLVADFSATPAQGSSPLAVSFTDMSQGSPITAWFWDFGDGATSTATSPSHTYNVAQTASFDVSLTVWIHGQSATKAQAELVTVEPGLFGTTGVLTTFSPGLADLLGAADLDGDGDLDVLATDAWGDTIQWWPNLGSTAGFAAAQTVVSDTAGAPGWLQAADLDGDGDQDVLYYTSNTMSWAENTDGAGSFAFGQVIAIITNGFSAAKTVDLDGDGDLDVVASSNSQGLVAWYPNVDGQGTFGAQQTLTASAPFAASTAVADFDGDGDIDVLAAGATTNYALSWFQNLDGGGAFGPDLPIGSFFAFSDWVGAGDLDGDGDNDAVGRITSFRTFKNVDGLGTFNLGKNIGGSLDTNRVLLQDVDGDADLDILATRRYQTPTGGLWWHPNQGGPNFFGPMEQLWNVSFPNDAIVADLDGDGDVDALATNWSISIAFVNWAPSLLGNPAWPFLGDGLQGAGGMPLLQGEGDLSGGSTVTLSLSNALPSSTTALVMGLSALAAPFKGGVLVPNPDLILAALPIDGNGDLVIASTWPMGVPAGVPIWLQDWVSDPTAPAGFAASNAIMATTVP